MLKPRHTPTRELVNLDGVWRFGIDTRLPEQPWLEPLDTPLEAAVPASYNDLFADPHVRDHVGWVYYQRDVRVPRGWHDDQILLRFDAATHAARVYVDDQLVGEHVGGYTPFDVDLTGSRRRRRIVPLDRRRQRRPHERDRAAGQDRGRHGRPPSADLLPRLLQLRRPRPLGLALQHGRASTSTDVTVVTGFDGDHRMGRLPGGDVAGGRGEGAPRRRVRKRRRRGDGSSPAP